MIEGKGRGESLAVWKTKGVLLSGVRKKWNREFPIGLFFHEETLR